MIPARHNHLAIGANQRGYLKVMFGLLLLVAVLALACWSWFEQWQSQPVTQSDEAVVFAVKRGDTMVSVVNQLADQADYAQPEVLRWYARYKGVAGKIKAGEFSLPPGTTPDQFLGILTDGEVLSYPVTIIEGWTFREMFAEIARQPVLEHTLSSPDEVMAALGKADEHPEGRFYPDTYLIVRGQKDTDLLKRAYLKMQDELEAAWARRDETIPLNTPYEALILASIIERETGVDDERSEISGVFARRLRKGMRLQTDPTVIYGVGESYQGDITRAHLRQDTPYNTYTRGGLTPTPIALPGRESLLAAVTPKEGTALYFVATGDGDGRHYFSSTLKEHNQALARYLRKLRQAPE